MMHVNAIEAMQKEIEYQLHDLQKLDLPPATENCLFVGSGDSYAAALAAYHASGRRSLCCYPTDIILNPSIASGRNVFVVSVSGRTRANIIAAQMAKRHGASTITAITAQPESSLANVCSQLIRLKYRSTGIRTPGTISYTASMLTCLSLVTEQVQQLLRAASIVRIYRKAENQAQGVIDKIIVRARDSSGKTASSYFLLGDGPLFAVATYGALKFNEVFGAKALAYPAEEFCHSPLFSFTKNDKLITMGVVKKGQADNDVGRRLSRRLTKCGFSSSYVDFGGGQKDREDDDNVVGLLLLRSTFFVQQLVLKIALRSRITDCYFMKNKNLLKISSDFIYDG